jgi:hypothetical protein
MKGGERCMYVKVYKYMVDNEKVLSHKMFFPVIVYIMMTMNFYNISYLTIGNIIDYFGLPRNNRYASYIAECINLLIKQDYLSVVLGEASNQLGINTLIGLSLVEGYDNKYNQIYPDEIDKIIECYKEIKDYTFASVFLAIKRSSFPNPHDGKMVESTTMAYSTILNKTSIKSKTTLAKYVKLLEEHGVFTIERDTSRSKNDLGKYDFKTINTYVFVGR